MNNRVVDKDNMDCTNSVSLTFLGTGTSQGVPMIGCNCRVCSSLDARDRRLRSSAMVECADTVVVIDTSMDFRQQMLLMKPDHLDGVLITHAHKDHIGGMDDLRGFNYIMGRSVTVYCEQRVREVLYKDFDYAFSNDPYPGVPSIDINLIDQDMTFSIGNLVIRTIRGMHHKLPVLGYVFNDKICYLTDMNSISTDELDKIKGVEVLVINALRHDEHISHFTLNQALDVIKYVSPNRCAYLTHMSHQMGLYQELMPSLSPENVALAYDGLRVEVR